MNKGEEVLEFINNKEEEHKVIEFKTRAQLAMGDETPHDPDWLAGLKEGCMFLARLKSSTEDALHLFTVLSKKEKSVWLCLALPEDKAIEYWVDSLRFSNKWDHFETLQEGYD